MIAVQPIMRLGSYGAQSTSTRVITWTCVEAYQVCASRSQMLGAGVSATGKRQLQSLPALGPT